MRCGLAHLWFCLGALVGLCACERPCDDSRDCPPRAPYCVQEDGGKVCRRVRTIPPPDVTRQGTDGGPAFPYDGG